MREKKLEIHTNRLLKKILNNFIENYLLFYEVLKQLNPQCRLIFLLYIFACTNTLLSSQQIAVPDSNLTNLYTSFP